MPDPSISTSVDADTFDPTQGSQKLLFIPEWTFDTLTPSDVHALVESLYDATRTQYTLSQSTLNHPSIVETYKERLGAQLTHNQPKLSPSELAGFTPRQDLTCTYVAASQTADILSGAKDMFGRAQRAAIWSEDVLLEKSTRHWHFQEARHRWMKKWDAYEITQDIRARNTDTVPESVASVGMVSGSREFVDWQSSRRSFKY